MSRAGSSTDHLITSVTGERHAENQKRTSTIRLLICTHGLPQQDIPLPDEGNEKDSDYDNDDNYVPKNKKEREPPFDLGGPRCIECGKKSCYQSVGLEYASHSINGGGSVME